MITSIENRATIGRVMALGFLLAPLTALGMAVAAHQGHRRRYKFTLAATE